MIPGRRAQQRALNRARVHALVHAAASARGHPFDEAFDLAAFTLTRWRGRGGARALERALERGRALADDLSLDHDLTLDQALSRAREDTWDQWQLHQARSTSASDHLRTRDFDLAHIRLRALALALVFDRDLELSVVTGYASEGQARQRARVPARLAGVAARLVPSGERARYAEEYDGELADLATTGADRRQQFSYAVQLLGRTPVLRAELRAARRRGVLS